MYEMICDPSGLSLVFVLTLIACDTKNLEILKEVCEFIGLFWTRDIVSMGTNP